MDLKETDAFVYAEAKKFLLGLDVPGVTPELLQQYLCPTSLSHRPTSIPEIYERILFSAQNANMKAGVIGRSIDGVHNLSKALSGFDPTKVLKTYGGNPEKLLDDIEKKVKPRGKIRRKPRSIWPQYCWTILSGAELMVEFRSASNFFEWVDFFDRDSRARPALPMLLSEAVSGVGFALACDFLKEMGYANFPKPDVHLKRIFEALRLCPDPWDTYQLFKSIVRLARHAGVTPYAADKALWLIGSGRFYDNPEIGNDGRIGSHRAEFIARMNQILPSDRRARATRAETAATTSHCHPTA